MISRSSGRNPPLTHNCAGRCSPPAAYVTSSSTFVADPQMTLVVWICAIDTGRPGVDSAPASHPAVISSTFSGSGSATMMLLLHRVLIGLVPDALTGSVADVTVLVGPADHAVERRRVRPRRDRRDGDRLA